MQTVFTKEEFAVRLRRVQKRMSLAELDLIIVTDPCNIYYLTGYDGWSFYTPQALLVPREGELLLFLRMMDVPGALVSSCLSEEGVLGYEDSLVQIADAHPFDVLVREIQYRWPKARKVGLETESYYFSVRGYKLLEAGLHNAELIDSQFLVNWVRFVKSPAEVALMRQAGVLLSKSFEAAFDAIKPGARECDVAAAVYAANLVGDENVGGNYTSSPAFILVNEKASMPHLPWSTNKIEQGAQLNLELMGNRLRYQVTMGRTVIVGAPSKRVLELEQIVREGIETVLEFIKPGVTCHDVAQKIYSFYDRHSIHKDSRCGYSLGITYPPTGGELTASIRRGDKTVLVPGVAMHFLPAIWERGASFMMSEPFVVTETGAECLADVERSLILR